MPRNALLGFAVVVLVIFGLYYLGTGPQPDSPGRMREHESAVEREAQRGAADEAGVALDAGHFHRGALDGGAAGHPSRP